MDRFHHYDSPLGGITLACDGDALTGLWFDGQKFFPVSPVYGAENLPAFAEAERWLDLYAKFTADDDGYDALMIDASQFIGSGSYISFDTAEIVGRDA